VKAYQTEEAATLLAGPLASAPTPVVSLQNGWGHMDLLSRLLHGIPLVAGATTIGAYWDDEGRFHASPAGETVFAPWGSEDAAAPAAEAARRFTEAGLRARTAPHAPEILWRKLVLNAAVNPLTALHAVTNGAIRATPALWAEAREAAREAVAVGAARGHIAAGYDPDPLLDGLLRDTAENRSSMAQDLARGRRTEADAIVGAVVREGREAGVATPVLASLEARLAEAEARR
jgi:2-dehydropantoate 2-reductase